MKDSEEDAIKISEMLMAETPSLLPTGGVSAGQGQVSRFYLGPMVNFAKVLDDRGEEWVLEQMVEGLCAGKTLYRIAKENHYPHVKFRQWVKADPIRLSIYHDALEVMSEKHVEDIFDELNVATVDSVRLSEMKIKVNQWMASKHHRKMYGDDRLAPETKVENNITIVHRME